MMSSDETSKMSEKSEKYMVNEPYVGGPSSSRAASDLDSDADTDSHRHSEDLERQATGRSARSERPAARASGDLRRTASNVLGHVVSRLSTRIREEPPPPPDGGLKAWVQVAAGFLVIFTTWGYVNAFGVFQSYYTGLLPVSASTISWIGSVQTFLSLMLGIFTGRLLDAGFFFPTYIVGAIIQLIGIFTMSLSTKYWQLMLTQGILTGLGNGIFFTPTLAMIATYFEKRRGLAVGLVTLGNSTGGALYPVITRQLLPKIGFGWTVRVLGFVNLGCLVIGLVFLRPRLPPRKSGPFIDVAALKDATYMVCVASVFFVMWTNYYTFYYVSSFGQQILGMAYSESANLTIIINAIGIPFRLLGPALADHIGPVSVHVPLFFAWTVVTFSWLAVKSSTGLYVFVCFYGAVSGAVQALMVTTFASLTPQLNMVGGRTGLAFGIISVASLTGPPLGGALQAADGGQYLGATVWAGCVTFIAACLMTTCRVMKVGKVVKVWC